MGELEVRADERPYWEECNYATSNRIIQGNLHAGQRAAISMGYYLKHIREGKLYLEGGYQSFGEYVKAECGMSESAASRHISRMEQFSEGGNSPKLAERWSEYSASQLQEILYLTDEQRETVDPDMTVKEIREIRKPDPEPESEPVSVVAEIPENSQPDDGQAKCITGKSLSGLCGSAAYCDKPYTCCAQCSEDCNGRCGWLDQDQDEPVDAEGEYLAAESERVDESYSLANLPQAKEKYLRRLAEILLRKMGPQMILESRGHMLDDATVEKRVKMLSRKIDGKIDIDGSVEAYACDSILEFFREDEDLGVSTYARFATQVRKAADTMFTKQKDGSIIDKEPCTEWVQDDPDDEKELATSQESLEDQEEVTNAEPEEISVDVTPQSVLADAKSWLEQYIESDVPKAMIDRQKIIVAALASMVCDLEEAEQETPEQPELPVMRNNDQRKAFLDSFHDWPVWFKVPEAAEVYYRYDLPDASIVICEYKHYIPWMSKVSGMDPEATATREYLLTPGYHYLADCKSSHTELIDYLRQMGKK